MKRALLHNTSSPFFLCTFLYQFLCKDSDLDDKASKDDQATWSNLAEHLQLYLSIFWTLVFFHFCNFHCYSKIFLSNEIQKTLLSWSENEKELENIAPNVSKFQENPSFGGSARTSKWKKSLSTWNKQDYSYWTVANRNNLRREEVRLASESSSKIFLFRAKV